MISSSEHSFIGPIWCTLVCIVVSLIVLPNFGLKWFWYWFAVCCITCDIQEIKILLTLQKHMVCSLCIKYAWISCFLKGQESKHIVLSFLCYFICHVDLNRTASFFIQIIRNEKSLKNFWAVSYISFKTWFRCLAPLVILRLLILLHFKHCRELKELTLFYRRWIVPRKMYFWKFMSLFLQRLPRKPVFAHY